MKLVISEYSLIIAFPSLVALKTAVLVHKHKPTFLAVDSVKSSLKKSFSQFKAAIFEQLSVSQLRISIPAQSCSFHCCIGFLLEGSGNETKQTLL